MKFTQAIVIFAAAATGGISAQGTVGNRLRALALEQESMPVGLSLPLAAGIKEERYANADELVNSIGKAEKTGGKSAKQGGTSNTSVSKSGKRDRSSNPSSNPTSIETKSFSATNINVGIPDNSAVGSTATLSVVSLPAEAVITNMRVTINMTHSYMGDIVVNLKAPNDKVLNLFNRHGSGGENMVNTVISSTPALTEQRFAFVAPSAPFTGTFMATAANNTGPTGYKSDAASFEELYSVPNGNWTLAMVDLGSGDIGTLTGWAIEFDYSTL
jgi:subtilisin-like proprotein convertase family protein